VISIQVRVAASLREHLTGIDGAESGRLTLEVPEQTTPAELISQLNIPPEQSLMVIVDNEMVTRPELVERVLLDGQTISLNPPIQAG